MYIEMETTMADASTRQAVIINDRIDECINAIGRRLEKDAAKLPKAQKKILTRSIRRGNRYTVAAIVEHALMKWADEIKAGQEVAWDDLADFIREYLNLAFVQQGRTSQVNLSPDDMENLQTISDYLAAYEPEVKMLKSRRRRGAINGRLIITLALCKAARDYGYKLPPF